MFKLMMEMKYKKLDAEHAEHIEELKRDIARAKLSIIAVENQLELGQVPEANISKLNELSGSMKEHAALASQMETLGRFLGDMVMEVA